MRIAVVTVTETEALAVESSLLQAGWSPTSGHPTPVVPMSFSGDYGEWTSSCDSTRISVLHLLRPGNTNSGTQLDRLYDFLAAPSVAGATPVVVIVFGCAGGLAGRASIGDTFVVTKSTYAGWGRVVDVAKASKYARRPWWVELTRLNHLPNSQPSTPLKKNGLLTYNQIKRGEPAYRYASDAVKCFGARRAHALVTERVVEIEQHRRRWGPIADRFHKNAKPRFANHYGLPELLAMSQFSIVDMETYGLCLSTAYTSSVCVRVVTDMCTGKSSTVLPGAWQKLTANGFRTRPERAAMLRDIQAQPRDVAQMFHLHAAAVTGLNCLIRKIEGRGDSTLSVLRTLASPASAGAASERLPLEVELGSQTVLDLAVDSWVDSPDPLPFEQFGGRALRTVLGPRNGPDVIAWDDAAAIRAVATSLSGIPLPLADDLAADWIRPRQDRPRAAQAGREFIRLRLARDLPDVVIGQTVSEVARADRILGEASEADPELVRRAYVNEVLGYAPNYGWTTEQVADLLARIEGAKDALSRSIRE